jgi:predicted RNase H-like nuclease (RuvC/YqgF family)
MIESIMYVGIGLLFGCLLGVAFVPLVQNRAIRLAVRRLEGRLPQSIGEIQADKDLLRAEFAMSARRFEITIEQLRDKITNQLVELSKKSNIINRLNLERNELKAEVANLRREVAGAQKTAQSPRQIRSAKDHRRRRGIKHRNSETGTVVSQGH